MCLIVITKHYWNHFSSELRFLFSVKLNRHFAENLIFNTFYFYSVFEIKAVKPLFQDFKRFFGNQLAKKFYFLKYHLNFNNAFMTG